MYRRVAIILLAASAGSAFAAEPACTTTVAPPAELAAWTSPGAMKAGNMSANAPLLAIGKAADMALLPTSAVHYAVRPEKPGGSANYGGLFGVDVKQAGTYRIALSTAAWIDVAGADRALQSAAHGHGAECTVSARRWILRSHRGITPCRFPPAARRGSRCSSCRRGEASPRAACAELR